MVLSHNWLLFLDKRYDFRFLRERMLHYHWLLRSLVIHILMRWRGLRIILRGRRLSHSLLRRGSSLNHFLVSLHCRGSRMFLIKIHWFVSSSISLLLCFLLFSPILVPNSNLLCKFVLILLLSVLLLFKFMHGGRASWLGNSSNFRRPSDCFRGVLMSRLVPCDDCWFLNQVRILVVAWTSNQMLNCLIFRHSLK